MKGRRDNLAAGVGEGAKRQAGRSESVSQARAPSGGCEADAAHLLLTGVIQPVGHGVEEAVRLGSNSCFVSIDLWVEQGKATREAGKRVSFVSVDLQARDAAKFVARTILEKVRGFRRRPAQLRSFEMRRGRREPQNQIRPVLTFFLAALISVSSVPGVAAKAADVSSVIFTLDSNHVQTVWPNARVTLKNLGGGTEVSTVSSPVGEYKLTGVLYGDYELTVTLAGFEPLTKRITVKAGQPAKVDFQLDYNGVGRATDPYPRTPHAQTSAVISRQSLRTLPTCNGHTGY